MNKGITLIELLLSVGLFSIVIISFLQLFGSAFKEQRKILIKNALLNNASYAIEYMARALRMAQKDENETCISGGSNYEITPSAEEIKFLNYKGECQKFLLSNDSLKVAKSSAEMDLTSSALKVKKLKFIGSDSNPNEQPKITFALEFETIETKPQKLNIQTTVSQRNLDLP